MRITGRVVSTAFIAALLLAVCSLPNVAARTVSPRATPAEVQARSWSDFNNDGYADLAIGAPFERVDGHAQAGAVYILFGDATGLTRGSNTVPAVERWTLDVPGIDASAAGSAAGDHFGFALASGDFNHDGFADLAVGIPGRDVGGRTDDGGVYVLFGSANGLVFRPSQHLKSLVPDATDPGTCHFGYALAALDAFQDESSTDATADNIADLAIGVPGCALGATGRDGGGVVLEGGHFLVTSYTTAEIKLQVVAIGGNDGDLSGAALAAGHFFNGPFDDLAVGQPGFDFRASGGAVRADVGRVDVVYQPGQSNADVYFRQGSTLPDTAEAHDRVGQVLATGYVNADGYDDLVIGVPREDVSGVVDAGLVHIVNSKSDGSGLGTTGGQVFTENTPGVPGTLSANDRFGSALAFGYFRPGHLDLAIGAPGEAANGLGGAGAVVVLRGSNTRIVTTGAQRWTQDSHAVIGDAERGDGFGGSLHAIDFNGDGPSDLAIGVPGEAVDGAVLAGSANVLLGTSNGNGLSSNGNESWDENSVGETARNGDHFGFALP